MNEGEFAPVLRSARRRPLWTPLASTRELQFDRADLECILPHRGEGLLLDKITAVDIEHGLSRATRRIAEDDRGFHGHFPGKPIYPGVLQVEIIGQAGGCLLYFHGRQTFELPGSDHPQSLRALKIHHAIFLDLVRPGDELTMLTKMLVCDEMTGIFIGQTINQSGVICTVAIVEVYVVDL